MHTSKDHLTPPVQDEVRHNELPEALAGAVLKKHVCERPRLARQVSGSNLLRKLLRVGRNVDSMPRRAASQHDNESDTSDNENKHSPRNIHVAVSSTAAPATTAAHAAAPISNDGATRPSQSIFVHPAVAPTLKLSPSSSAIPLLNTFTSDDALTSDPILQIHPGPTTSIAVSAQSPHQSGHTDLTKTTNSALATFKTYRPSSTLVRSWVSTSTVSPLPQLTGSSSNMTRMGSPKTSSARNTAIAGGTVGGIAAAIALVLLILLFRRRKGLRLPTSLRYFTQPFMQREGALSRLQSSRSLDNPISAPLGPPTMIDISWNHEESFATQGNPTPPTPRTRRFRGPLALNPPTPPPSNIKFSTPKLPARTFFRSSNMSSQSLPSIDQHQRASIHTKSSIALPDRYERLPSPIGSLDESEERRATAYFSQSSAEAGTSRTPSYGRRMSQATTKSADSEPARFRSVPSWVNYQSQKQMKGVRPISVPDDMAILTLLKGAEQRIDKHVEPNTDGTRKKRSWESNSDFEVHPGTKVDVPGLKGRRIESATLDRNIWGWGMRLS